MSQELELLASGMILGLASGSSPGPLLTLVFSETLKHGTKEGIKIAIAPLITDLPIILLTLFALSSLTGYSLILGIVSFLGACYLTYLGVENLRYKPAEVDTDFQQKGTLRRGIIANFLNPHPYLFWLSIGCPIILVGLNNHVSSTALFILGFYSLLVGSKVAIAFAVEKSKLLIKSKYYIYVVRFLGLGLVLFALIFAKDGLELIGLF